jgi:hypothetical protein
MLSGPDARTQIKLAKAESIASQTNPTPTMPPDLLGLQLAIFQWEDVKMADLSRLDLRIRGSIQNEENAVLDGNLPAALAAKIQTKGLIRQYEAASHDLYDLYQLNTLPLGQLPAAATALQQQWQARQAAEVAIATGYEEEFQFLVAMDAPFGQISRAEVKARAWSLRALETSRDLRRLTNIINNN